MLADAGDVGCIDACLDAGCIDVCGEVDWLTWAVVPVASLPALMSGALVSALTFVFRRLIV